MKEILKKAEAVKRITDKKLEEVNSVIEDLVMLLREYHLDDNQTLKKFDYHGFGFGWICSNVGCDLDLWELNEFTRFPARRADFGKGRYQHGDFNSFFKFMSYTQTKRFIKILPNFIENFTEVLDNLRQEIEDLPKIEIKINGR